MSKFKIYNKENDNNINRMFSSLAKKILSFTEIDYIIQTEIPGLRLVRSDKMQTLTCSTLEPSIFVIAQGRKKIILGGESYFYDPQNYLISSVQLPVIASIVEASPEKPYLAMMLTIDQDLLSQLILENDLIPSDNESSTCAVAVNKLSPALLSAFDRLLNLLYEPENISVLSPLIQKEIYYRLLNSQHGLRLKQIVSADYNGFKISNTVGWLKDNFVNSLHVNELAARSNMSLSSFHHHFKKVTTMTPLQFQKQLRLSEARRLMLIENHDASSASFEVGYESPSQFSREYSRLFGAPPLRDIKNLNEQLSINRD